jgi:flagellin
MTSATLNEDIVMALNSVNTNTGAQVALQNLNNTNSELNQVQSRINTGKRVASVKDNGAVWAIAQGQRSTSQALNAVKDSLQRGISVVDVAIAGGESVSDLLGQMKEKALAGADSQLNTNSRAAMSADFVSLRDQIAKAVSNANFNGFNLLKSGAVDIAALADETGTSKITVAAQALHLASANVTITAAASLGLTAATSAAQLTAVIFSIAKVSLALSKLGTGSKALSTHLSFVNRLQDAIDAGIGNIVDADLAKESAKIQALQTKQQLGFQALSIANQGPSSLLSLFR